MTKQNHLLIQKMACCIRAFGNFFQLRHFNLASVKCKRTSWMKGQPLGKSVRSGGCPGMVFNTWSLIAMLGIDSISMLVYGCFGSLNSIDAVDTSAILPAYITATLLHTSATIPML